MKPDICIYHAPCADGFGAAWAIWKRWPDIVFHPGVYGKAPPDVAGKHVLLVDFSYPIDWKKDFEGRYWRGAKSLAIIDHHKTAQERLTQPGINWLPDAGQFEWQWQVHGMDGSPFVWARFDMEKSGAVMAWEWAHAAPVPTLLRYVQDRDLWRFDLPDSREVAAYVFSMDYDFEDWSAMADMAEDDDQLRSMVEQGNAIERKHHKDVGELLKITRREMVIGGVRVPVANLPYTMASDAAGRLAEEAPFAACYFDRGDGQRVFSLRSRGRDGADVSAIAARYGGGGHRNAAGFQTPIGWEGESE